MAELWRRRAALSTAAVAAVVACSSDRGCGSSTERPGTFASALAVKQDCPTGLARCVGGSVEVTEGHPSCAGCPCAWRRVLVCPEGCAVENEALARDVGAAPSLCRSPHPPATRPPVDAGAARCPAQGERYFCHGGTVFACPPGASAVPVAVCTYGCARNDETLSDPGADVGGATAVMCRLHDREVVDP